MIPEIVVIAMLNIHIRRWAIEARQTELNGWMFCHTGDFLCDALLNLNKGQFDIVVASDESHMTTIRGNETTQRREKSTMRCNNAFKFASCYCIICCSLCIIWGSYEEIKAVTIDNQFNICGIT